MCGRGDLVALGRRVARVCTAVPVRAVPPPVPAFICSPTFVLGGLGRKARGARRPARRQAAVLSLQDLGVTKVGHMKRILCGIKELSRGAPATEA